MANVSVVRFPADRIIRNKGRRTAMTRLWREARRQVEGESASQIWKVAVQGEDFLSQVPTLPLKHAIQPWALLLRMNREDSSIEPVPDIPPARIIPLSRTHTVRTDAKRERLVEALCQRLGIGNDPKRRAEINSLFDLIDERAKRAKPSRGEASPV